jgi:acetyl esterase/lipase
MADDLTPPGVELRLNQTYRPGNPIWQLDIARPAHRKGLLPAVLAIHGGGWHEGERTDERSTILHLAASGYVGISVSYRLSGEAPFPACVDDCVSALRWVRTHARELGIDPSRIGAYGHSAGGHLVTMLGLAEPSGQFAPGYLEGAAGPVNAVCASSAPTDFVDWGADGGDVRGLPFLFGKAPAADLPALMKRASPLTYVTVGAPPFLLLHGSADKTVPPAQTLRLWTALRQAGAPLAERIVYEGQPHEYVLSYESLYWPQVLSFFDETIGSHPGQFQRELKTGAEFQKVEGHHDQITAWLRKFDTNGDGYVSRSEFPGSDKLFERLGGDKLGKIPLDQK